MNTNKQAVLILILFSLTALVILLHQLTHYGMLFNLNDFLHHENFAIILVVFGLGIFLGIFAITQSKKNR